MTHTANGGAGRRPRATTGSLAAPPCEDRCDLLGGCLNSEQRVRWSGPVPTSKTRAELPHMMDRLHFAAVERSVAGMIRCDLRPGAVDCRLLGRWLALQFADPETDREVGYIVRRWRITGGGLARPETALGSITFGWESGAETAEGVEQSLWVRVEGYPSRFIRRAVPGRARKPGPLSALYARYHSVVTCRYLRAMAVWMRQRTDAVVGGNDA